jgi:hypothetical protein
MIGALQQRQSSKHDQTRDGRWGGEEENNARITYGFGRVYKCAMDHADNWVGRAAPSLWNTQLLGINVAKVQNPVP